MPLNERHRLKSLCVIALLFANVLWLIAVQINSFTQRNGAPPEGWSWSAIVILDFAFIYGLIRVLGNYYRDSNSAITNEGIIQKTLLGTRVLRWADIGNFTMIGYNIHLPGPSGKLTLNTGAYVEPSEVLLERVTSHIGRAAGDDEVDEEDDEDDSYLSPPPDTKVI